MHHRFLHPRLGHFLTPDFRAPDIYDPSTFTEPYAYAAGNPIMFWDPDGLATVLLFEKTGNLRVWYDDDESVDDIYEALLEHFRLEGRDYVLRLFKSQMKRLIKARIQKGPRDAFGSNEILVDEIEWMTSIAYDTDFIPQKSWMIGGGPEAGWKPFQDLVNLTVLESLDYSSDDYFAEEYKATFIDPALDGLRQGVEVIKNEAQIQVAQSAMGLGIGKVVVSGVAVAGSLRTVPKTHPLFRNVAKMSHDDVKAALKKDGKYVSNHGGSLKWAFSPHSHHLFPIWAGGKALGPRLSVLGYEHIHILEPALQSFMKSNLGIRYARTGYVKMMKKAGLLTDEKIVDALVEFYKGRYPEIDEFELWKLLKGAAE